MTIRILKKGESVDPRSLVGKLSSEKLGIIGSLLVARWLLPPCLGTGSMWTVNARHGTTTSSVNGSPVPERASRTGTWQSPLFGQSVTRPPRLTRCGKLTTRPAKRSRRCCGRFTMTSWPWTVRTSPRIAIPPQGDDRHRRPPVAPVVPTHRERTHYACRVASY